MRERWAYLKVGHDRYLLHRFQLNIQCYIIIQSYVVCVIDVVKQTANGKEEQGIDQLNYKQFSLLSYCRIVQTYTLNPILGKRKFNFL
jgi:hypothetical protein